MCQYLTPEQFGFVLALFITASSLPSDSLATILALYAPCPMPHASIRWNQQGQVVRRPSPAGYCLPPTAQLPITERARSRRAGPLFQYVTEPGDFHGQNDLFLSTRRRSPVDRSLVAKALNRCVPRSSPTAQDTGPWLHLELVSRVSGRHFDGDGRVSQVPGEPS